MKLADTKINPESKLEVKYKYTQSKKQAKAKRRPSFDIARDYMEMNFAVLVSPEQTPSQIKKAKKQAKKLRRQESRRKHRVRNAIFSSLALLVICAGMAALWWVTSLQPVNPKDTDMRQFIVDKGATTDQIATALQKAGFIRNSLAYKIYSRLNNKSVQAGTHTLSPSYSVPLIADKLSMATVDEIDVQVPPGLTLNQLKSTWKKYGYSDVDIEKAYLAKYDNAILNDRPEGSSLEGYIYPETYRIYSDDKLEVIISKALDQFEKVVAENDLKSKLASHGLSLHEGITLASIVTKEVTNTDDQKIVAGVFYNRLSDGGVLGSDVTYQYAYNQGLCSVNAPSCSSEYNTRIYPGLPPGPIANPSLSALTAVANPTNTDYYYFVAGDGNDAGITFFSVTLDEHNANIQAHCRTLCK